MEAFSFGSYYPGDSAIHRLDPRTKLLLGFVFLITTLTVNSFRGLVPVAIFVVLIYTACRLTLMMAGMSAITLTTPTLDLTAGFECLLAPFARVGLPAHELGMIMGIALRFMPQFATEMKQTADAQASRGARVTGGPLGGVRMLGSVAIPLFTGVFRHAETLSAAMDARCYHGEQGRTRLHALAFGRGDALAAMVTALLLICVIVINLQLV